jgi:hypothetical protein
MADTDDENDQCVVLNSVDDAVRARANAKQVIGVAELFDAMRSGLVGKLPNAVRDPGARLGVEPA